MIEIIPAIDIIDGKCVRLEQGDYSKKKVYNTDPLEVAKMFESHGIKRLHMVDLDGAKSQHVVNMKVLETVVSRTSLKIDFGGGIKSDTDISDVFDAGAKWATIGSIAVSRPEKLVQWLDVFGSEKIILSADVKNNNIAITGWLDVTNRDIFLFLDEYKEKGIHYVLCTDISKDGMLVGTATELYKQIKERQPELYLIASGGVKDINDVHVLNEMNIDGVIIGKAIYEGKIILKELEKFVNA